MERYNVYSTFLKETYGEKVYKLPISIPDTCPNRDGTLGVRGCVFCGSCRRL
jgi:radical SAM superfamily enzyme